MDNLTHSLVGLAMSRAGLNRTMPKASLLLVLAANAPDSDIVMLFGGPLRYFEWHRGYTHSLLGLPFLALLSVMVTAIAYRRRLPWIRACLVAALGVASHLLLDWTNNYGIRLLLPWSSSWFHLDINWLYDVVLLAVLAFAAVWPWFARLVSSEVGAREGSAGRGIARFALLFFALYDAGRAIVHHRAQQQLDARLYDDAAPLASAAFPDALNPLRWSGAVESINAQYLFPPSTENLADGEPEVFYKIPATPTLLAAGKTEAFRFMQYFARFPVWSSETDVTAAVPTLRVELTDLRFGKPHVGAFRAVALVNSSNQVNRSEFTYGDGSAIRAGSAVDR